MIQTIECQRCKKPTPKRSAAQRYCPSCSEASDVERKSKWAKAHPQRPRDPKLAAERQEALRIVGAARSERRGIGWPAVTHPNLARMATASVPFGYELSKNHIWRMGGRGHVDLRKESRSAMDALVWVIRRALRGHAIKQNRLWVDILVQKPNHKGDAVNVVDSVMDCVKKATALDDRWYSIRRLDWEIVKDDPSLFVGIGQEDVEDAQVCSYCGRILTLGHFGKHKGNRLGLSRVCRACSRTADASRRAR